MMALESADNFALEMMGLLYTEVGLDTDDFKEYLLENEFSKGVE